MKKSLGPFRALHCQGCGQSAKTLVGWSDYRHPGNHLWMICGKCFDLADAWETKLRQHEKQRLQQKGRANSVTSEPEKT